MSLALFRKVTNDAARLIRRNAAAEDPFGKTSLALSNLRRLQSRPQFLGRGKQTGHPPPPPPPSSSSVGFVGWYLGMVKSRPVLTKSVTSSLIYIAADLSSQVSRKTFLKSFYLIFNMFLLWIVVFYQTIAKNSSDSWLGENSKDGWIWSLCLGSNTSLLVQFYVETLAQTGFHHNV